MVMIITTMAIVIIITIIITITTITITITITGITTEIITTISTTMEYIKAGEYTWCRQSSGLRSGMNLNV